MTGFQLIISISQGFSSQGNIQTDLCSVEFKNRTAEKRRHHDSDIILTSLTKIRQSVRKLRKEKQKVLTKIRDRDILVSEKIHCLLIAVIF